MASHQGEGQREHNSSTEETVDGSDSSLCSLIERKEGISYWELHQVQTRPKQFPSLFLILYSDPHNSGCKQNFQAFLFAADSQTILNMIVHKIDEEKKDHKLAQVLGRKRDAEGSLEFVSSLQTKMNNHVQVKIYFGVDNGPGMVAAAAEVKNFHDGDDNKQEFYLKTSEKLSFTEEELKYPNARLKNVTNSELQRIKFSDLCVQTFSMDIVCYKPKMAQSKTNVIIEVTACDDPEESSSVMYPVQFHKFDDQFFIPEDEKQNKEACLQLGKVYSEAVTMLQDVDEIIAFLIHGEYLTSEDIQGLSTSKEKSGELLRLVIEHKNLVPAFLEALRSSGKPQNMELVEMITTPKQKEETSATQLV